jgi:methoxymalonate biosynthesis acyl carrier protein
MTIERELIDFLKQKYAVEVDENAPLIDSGLIDSLVLLEVVNHVEKQTGARVPDDQVTHDNFETVSAIAALVRRLTRQDAGTAAT